MNQIYSCKLYKASRRKQKIQSALANPVNEPLLVQLREYLDDEYITEDILEPERSENSKGGKPADNLKTSDSKEDSQNTPIDKSTSKSSDKSSSVIDSPSNSQDPVELEDSEDNKEDSKGVTSAVTASLASISVLDIDSLKGLLNSTDETSGIIRSKLDTDKKELWLYYQDSVNLNDVMTPVIELLEAANYQYLTFNRLARSVNAIVFEYSIDISDGILKTSEAGGEDIE